MVAGLKERASADAPSGEDLVALELEVYGDPAVAEIERYRTALVYSPDAAILPARRKPPRSEQRLTTRLKRASNEEPWRARRRAYLAAKDLPSDS